MFAYKQNNEADVSPWTEDSFNYVFKKSIPQSGRNQHPAKPLLKIRTYHHHSQHSQGQIIKEESNRSIIKYPMKIKQLQLPVQSFQSRIIRSKSRISTINADESKEKYSSLRKQKFTTLDEYSLSRKKSKFESKFFKEFTGNNKNFKRKEIVLLSNIKGFQSYSARKNDREYKTRLGQIVKIIKDVLSKEKNDIVKQSKKKYKNKQLRRLQSKDRNS